MMVWAILAGGGFRKCDGFLRSIQHLGKCNSIGISYGFAWFEVRGVPERLWMQREEYGWKLSVPWCVRIFNINFLKCSQSSNQSSEKYSKLHVHVHILYRSAYSTHKERNEINQSIHNKQPTFFTSFVSPAFASFLIALAHFSAKSSFSFKETSNMREYSTSPNPVSKVTIWVFSPSGWLPVVHVLFKNSSLGLWSAITLWGRSTA